MVGLLSVAEELLDIGIYCSDISEQHTCMPVLAVLLINGTIRFFIMKSSVKERSAMARIVYYWMVYTFILYRLLVPDALLQIDG